MSGKLCFLVCFILVLGMTAVSPAGLDDDPNLAGWWKLDGDALDSSANGRDGTIYGGALFIDPGLHGQAMSFDGSSGYVNIDGYKGVNAVGGVQHAFSVANWVRCTYTSGDREMVTWGTSAGRQRLTWRVYNSTLRTEHASGNLRGNTVVSDGEWHHVALTVAEGANLRQATTKLYVDGAEDTYQAGSNNPYELTPGADVRIGMSGPQNGRYFLGDLDDVRIYDRVLDPNEIAELAVRPKSYKADPANGATVEDVAVVLGWTPGDVAIEHDVYFGTTADLGADQLLGRVSTNSALATDLQKDTTYYWRVDDIAADGSVATGDTWSFWVAPRMAYAPSIEDGKAILGLTASLTWTAGWSPVFHYTYFGTDRDQVANATGAPPSMDIGIDPGPLEPGTTYYWRVDEFYGTDTATGDVWSFSTVPVIPMSPDPNLVAHWAMDDAAGDVVLDMSGNANHALVFGGAQVVDGAIEFDGVDDILEVPDSSINGIFDVNGSEFTAVMSVTPSRLLPNVSNHNIGNVLLSRGSDAYNDNFEFGFSAEGNAMIYTDTDGGDTTAVVGDGEITAGAPHQVIVVYDANNIDIYLDGVRYNTRVSGVFFDQAAGSPFTIGDTRHIETPYGGLVDDIKIFNKAMTTAEVRQAYGELARAYEPDPAAGSTDVQVVTMLAWLAGDGAEQHDVYLGTDKAAVAAADSSDTTGIYRGRLTGTTYTPETLEFSAKYYWRVDEISMDGGVVCTTTGPVWSFTTDNELVIFEADTPFPYDNTTDPFLSSISLDLDPAQDWTDPIGRISVSYTGQAGAGSVAVDDTTGAITVVGRGADIWGTADEFQYAYTTLMMNGSMTVKVDSFASTHNSSKAGIMIRETLDPGSAYAGIFATGAKGVIFEARTMANQNATAAGAAATAEEQALTAPVWIKIERTFPMVNAYYSTDGVTFVPMAWNPQVVPMSPAPIYIGLAVTSHSGADTFATAAFSELTSDGGVAPGPLTSVEVGGLGANSAEPMYLVLEDASGASAAVMNPDPAATQQTSATDFTVELANFNIDLSAVVKATLVVGNLDAPAAGGTGELTIHNVRLGAAPKLVSAFAFGSRLLDCATYSDPSVNYTMVQHVNKKPATIEYDPAKGYGYDVVYPVDSPFGNRNGFGVFGPFDDSANNRNEFSDDCPEQLYDSFIGAKDFTNEVSAATMGDMDTPSPNPEGLIFRVDVPNGFYRFVGAFGEADNGHAHRILAEDGGSGPPANIGSNYVVLVSNHDQSQYALNPTLDEAGDGVFARVGFDGRIPPPGDGIGADPQFVDMDENGMPTDAANSPILEVTQGYIRIHQLQGNSNDGPGGSRDANGGDIVLLELWKIVP